jgi:cytochrome c-type biogenesis protein CcsB
MFKMSEYSFVAAALCLGLACLIYLAYAVSGLRAARLQTAGGPLGGSTSVTFASGPHTQELGRYATIIGWLAMATLTMSLVFRTFATGHGPFANMYEFSIAFAWGILVAYFWFERKYGQRILAVAALPIALGLLIYAVTVPSTIEPLVPALQNNLLLTVHVAVAIIAYGSFAIAFGAALLYIVQGTWALVAAGMAVGLVALAPVGAVTVGGMTGILELGALGAAGGGLLGAVARRFGAAPGLRIETGGRWGLPKPKILEEIGYRAIVIGFPFLTLTVILGAVWADVAWGKYWSWDPKETASLVTWLIYATYLHARVVRGWRGNAAAWLLMLGFAATIFTYFGNLFFVGLHSYAGLAK